MSRIYLALSPHIRGLGYVCIEMPNRLLDYGVITSRPWDSERLLKRLNKIINFYAPHLMVVKDANTIESKRMRKFINQITECAIEHSVPIHQYSRDQVKHVFAKVGCSTKQDIADIIANQWLTELKDRCPIPRRSYEPEDYNMSIFDALSLVMTHEFLEK